MALNIVRQLSLIIVTRNKLLYPIHILQINITQPSMSFRSNTYGIISKLYSPLYIHRALVVEFTYPSLYFINLTLSYALR